MSQEANVLHKDLRGPDLHPPGPHTHVEADITNLDKYTQSQTDTLIANAITQFSEGGGGATPDATSFIKGKLALTGDLAGTADAPTVPGLATKQAALGFTPEDSANKITDPTFTANSDTYYASQKATKTYIAGQVASREPAIVASTTSKYWRGDKTFQTLDTSVIPENGNLYYTNGRFDTQLATKTTSNLSEGANLYYTDARVRANRLNQMSIPIASVSMNGQKVTSMADPALAQDAATKAYVDSVATGLTVKASVVAATTANITLSGPQTIDGISVIAGDRVLVKNQTTGADNGIYVVASGAWSRATDADTSPEVTSGMFMFVQQGTVNGDASFVLTTANPITLGTTALSFTQFSGAADLIGGAGLVRTANTFDVVGTAGRILVNADSIDIDSGYVGQTSITTLGTIATGTWNGTTIAVAHGGTGGTTAATARANLGAVNIAGDTMTGALTVPNLTNSSLTAGSIVYAGTAGLLSQDNANLFFDTTNKVLAIGTNTPNTVSLFNTAAFEINNNGGSKSDITQRVGTGYGTHFFAASNGTIASPTISNAGNGLGALEFLGYTGSAYAIGAFIGVQLAPSGTIGSTSMPTNLLFQNALRKQVNTSANSMIISSKKAITLWGGLSSDPTTANFRVDQPVINLPGVVQTAGTTALVGTETLFTNDFKIGDTVNVSGETSRIVATITDDTHMTVTVAFSSSTTALTYTTPARTVFTARGNGQVGIGTSTPTAFLNLPAGTANATTAPLKFTAGTNLTSPEAGAMEFDGTLLYYTTGSLARQTVATKAYVDAQIGGGGVLTLDSISTTTRNGLTAINGMLINNSTVNQFQKYENSKWVDISKSPATKVVAMGGDGFSADYYCDGTADDVQIQAAITAASGGSVYIKGSATGYDITASISIPSNTSVISDITTVFKANASLSSSLNMFTNSAGTGGNTNIKIIGGKMDGNVANRTGSRTEEAGHNICFVDSSYCEVSQVYSQNALSAGVALIAGSNNNLINGNTIVNGNWHGVLLTGTAATSIAVYENTVSNNKIDNNGNVEGVGVELARSALRNIVTSNVCSNSAEGGIHAFYQSYFNVIDGNICTLNNDNGISLVDEADFTIVTNNQIYESVHSGINSTVAFLTRGGKECVIANNLIYQCGYNGIRADTANSLDGSIIQNNLIEHCGYTLGSGSQTRGVYILGANSLVFSGNKVNNSNDSGIHLIDISKSTISNNHAEGNGNRGMLFDFTSSGIQKSIINNNQCIANGGSGLVFNKANSYLEITNNQLLDNTGNGLDVRGITRSVIANNLSKGNSSVGLNIQDDSASTASTYNTISGNIVTGNTAAGIKEIGSADNNNYYNNDARNNTTSNFSTVGTNDNFAHNQTGASLENHSGFTALGNIDFNNTYKIVNLVNPTSAQDGATKAYVDSVAQGLSVKPSAIVATTTTLPTYTYLSGVITMTSTGVIAIDSHNLALNDVVLIKDETSTNQPYNGLYTVTTAGAIGVALILTRHTSMDASTEFSGGFVFVESGTVNAGAGFVCTNTGSVTVGTTNVSFTQFSGAGEITAGNGLSKSGNTLSIDTSITVDKTTAQTLTNKTFTSPAISSPTGIVQADIGGLTTASSPTFAGLNLGTGNINTVGNIEIDGAAARDITVARAASGVGNNLTIQPGGAQSGVSNTAGGALILSAAITTGTQRGTIQFWPTTNGSTGSTDNNPSYQAVMFSGTANAPIFSLGNTSASTTGFSAASQNAYALSGQVAGGLGMYRHTTSNTAGNSLTVGAGGATSGATDKAGGNLLLRPGISTGTGKDYVSVQGYTPALSTGTSDNTLLDRTIIGGFKALTNNSAINLVNATLASNTLVGGIIRYAIEVFDSTNLQMEVGEIMFACVNKGGAFSLNTMTQIGSAKQTLGSGTLTITWAISAANPAVISVNANSSLTPASGYPRITYTIENFTQQAIAIQ